MSSDPAAASLRIASLLPSATEIVCSLGLEDALVAVSHSCDFAGRVASLPRVTRTRVPHGAPSREIDRVVRDCLHRGESLYQLDEGLLESLRPDLIVTQALCEVCAVGPAEVGRAVPALSSHPRVITLEPRTLEEVFDAIEAVGEAVGRYAGGRAAGQGSSAPGGRGPHPRRRARPPATGGVPRVGRSPDLRRALEPRAGRAGRRARRAGPARRAEPAGRMGGAVGLATGGDGAGVLWTRRGAGTAGVGLVASAARVRATAVRSRGKDLRDGRCAALQPSRSESGGESRAARRDPARLRSAQSRSAARHDPGSHEGTTRTGSTLAVPAPSPSSPRSPCPQQ